MNAHVDLQQIELARVHAQVNQVARSLVALSDVNDTVTTIENGAIHMVYSGRGLEQIRLALSDNYTIECRINYLKDNLKRLTKIKNYILECMA